MIAGLVRRYEERLLQQRSDHARLPQLDALRGIAAFCVIWYHLRLAFPSVRSSNPLIAAFTSGHQAVELFFILSGYVLGIPYWLKREIPYGRYILRRFFRIYVPYLGALLLAWVGAGQFLYSRLPLTPWFYKTWQTPLTWPLFVQHLFFSPSPAINTAFWSLRFEAEFSILLPVFCWIVMRLHPMIVLALCVASYTLSWHIATPDLSSRMMWFPMFFLGLLLSRNAAAIRRWWYTSYTAWHWIVPLVGIGLYLHFVRAGTAISDALTAIGSCLFIVCALYSTKVAAVLQHGLLEYLGRISYSLYLVHGTVLFAAINLLYGHVPLPVLSTVYGVCALVVAHLYCVAVEEPAIRTGRRASADRLHIRRIRANTAST